MYFWFSKHWANSSGSACILLNLNGRLSNTFIIKFMPVPTAPTSLRACCLHNLLTITILESTSTLLHRTVECADMVSSCVTGRLSIFGRPARFLKTSSVCTAMPSFFMICQVQKVLYSPTLWSLSNQDSIPVLLCATTQFQSRLLDSKNLRSNTPIR